MLSGMEQARPAAATPAPATAYTDADYAPWLEHDSTAFVRWFRRLTQWIWDHWYRLEAHGVEHVPAAGAFVLVPNHSSYMDPFLQVSPIDRIVRFMAKSSLFDYPLMRSFMKGGGAFPVMRGRNDVFAMELARRLLLKGFPVVVYPEGTRFRDSLELGPAKRGAARLALELDLPLVPCATWGVKRPELYERSRWQRPRTIVMYGQPMAYPGLEPTVENIDRVRDEVWARVHQLYQQAAELDRSR